MNKPNLSEINPDFLHPITHDAFLPKMSPWTIAGGITLMIIVVSAIASTFIIKYKVTVKAPFTVRPIEEINLIQAQKAGKVIKIAVKVNQSINHGDLIARLDNSELQTQIKQRQTQISQGNLEIQRIEARISLLNQKIELEKAKKQQSITIAQQEFEKALRDYTDQQDNSPSKVTEAQANLQIAQQELAKAETELKKAIADLNSLTAALKAAQSRVKRYQTVAEVGALAKNQLEEAQLEYEQQKTAVEAQKSTIAGHRATIEGQKHSIIAAQEQLKQAKIELNPSSSSVNIARENIKQAETNAEQSITNLAQEKQSLQQQKIQLKKQLQRDYQQLQQLNIEQEQTEIRASIDGIITQLYLRNSGQVVEFGEKIAEIIPDNPSLTVKSLIPPQDIQKIQPQQTAILKISACPYPTYGTLLGKITDISEDTFLKDSTTNANISFHNQNQAIYEAKIQPQRSTFGQGNQQCVLKSGMEGEAEIITREENLSQFFLRKARLIGNF